MTSKHKLPLLVIIKRVVGVTLILALLEIVFIFFYMNSKNSKKTAVSTPKEINQAHISVLKDSMQLSGASVPVIVRKQEQVNTDTVYKSEPIEPIAAPEIKKKVDEAKVKQPATTQPLATKLLVQPSKPEKVVEQIKKPEEVKKQTPSVVEPAKTIVQRQMSRDEMTQLLNDIVAQKGKFNNASNCIQIRKSKTSNIDNGFEVATFLKQNGFIISGREIVNSTPQGVQIDASGSCIKITIGNL